MNIGEDVPALIRRSEFLNTAGGPEFASLGRIDSNNGKEQREPIRAHGGSITDKPGYRARYVGKAPLTGGGKSQGGANVIAREVGEVVQDLIFRHPAGEVFQYVVYRDAGSIDTGLPGANGWIYRDSVLPDHGPIVLLLWFTR
jgi:hypothetical protein